MKYAGSGFLASLQLQVLRFWRFKSRLVGSIIQPIFWMLFFGIGFTNSVRLIGPNVSYMAYLIPGVIMMTIFSAALFSGLSVIWDKEFGFLKVLLVSPAPRKVVMLGRISGDAIIALIQGIVIAIAGYALDPTLDYTYLPIVLLIALLVAYSTTSLGIIIASRMRSFEGFGLIINLISMPLIFASGVFFPIDAMPEWMQVIAYASPLTYGVDAARELLLGFSTLGLMMDLTALLLITIVLVLIAMMNFERITIA